MNIHLATDHAGFEHKEALKALLLHEGHSVVDHGAYTHASDDDYPDYILPLTEALRTDPSGVGIIFGGSGQGEMMVANRALHIRCALYYGGPTELVTLSREHNNANVLSIGARFVSLEEMYGVVKLWLTTSFSNDNRHIRRLSKFL